MTRLTETMVSKTHRIKANLCSFSLGIMAIGLSAQEHSPLFKLDQRQSLFQNDTYYPLHDLMRFLQRRSTVYGKIKSMSLKPETCVQILAYLLTGFVIVNYLTLGSLSFHIYKIGIVTLNAHSIRGRLNGIPYIQHLVSTSHLKMSIFFLIASFFYFALLFILMRFFFFRYAGL